MGREKRKRKRRGSIYRWARAIGAASEPVFPEMLI
jgi:hypothetical protein